MVKCKYVEIAWHSTEHGKEPVYSLDFHPSSGALMTAGVDREIKAWKVRAWRWTWSLPASLCGRGTNMIVSAHMQVEQGEDGYPGVEFAGTLGEHNKTVNCVRFSPSGGWRAALHA